MFCLIERKNDIQIFKIIVQKINKKINLTFCTIEKQTQRLTFNVQRLTLNVVHKFINHLNYHSLIIKENRLSKISNYNTFFFDVFENDFQQFLNRKNSLIEFSFFNNFIVKKQIIFMKNSSFNVDKICVIVLIVKYLSI